MGGGPCFVDLPSSEKEVNEIPFLDGWKRHRVTQEFTAWMA